MNSSFDRRTTMLGIAATAALGSIASTSKARAETQENYGPTLLTGRADLLPLARSIKYGRGKEPVIWWKSLTTYGVIEGERTPLYKQDWAVVQAATDLPDGGFQGKTLEIIFNSDVNSGEVIDAFINPYTGERIEIPWGINGPSTTDYTAKETVMPAALPGATFEHDIELGPATSVNNEIWIPENFTTVATFAAPGIPPFTISERSTLRSQLNLMKDMSVDFVPGSATLESVTSWSAWLKMGDRPGNRMTSGFGQKVKRFEDVPSQTLAMIEKNYPEIIADPKAALTRSPGFIF